MKFHFLFQNRLSSDDTQYHSLYDILDDLSCFVLMALVCPCGSWLQCGCEFIVQYLRRTESSLQNLQKSRYLSNIHFRFSEKIIFLNY